MNFLPVPKLMKWDWNLTQYYHCNQSVLVTSGCSFTSSTSTLDCASSWPGYVRDRCKFDYAVDWSYPGAGNLYISDSIIEYIKSLSDIQKKNVFVIVMWSGLDREEEIFTCTKQPCINNLSYQAKKTNLRSKQQQTLDSYNYIFKTKEYLEANNIPFAFTFFTNVLSPPYLPIRDRTHKFDSFLDAEMLSRVRGLSWAPPNTKDFLYDFSFYHNYLDQSPDMYHPNSNCVLDWTDSVLLPSLEQQNLITKCNT